MTKGAIIRALLSYQEVITIDTSQKTIALFVGPSGSGKTTVADTICKRRHLKQICSYTTRPPRTPDEIGHIFLTEEEFDELEDYVAYTEFNGYRYCATAAQVEECDIYVIDVDGLQYFKAAYNGDKIPVVFYFDVPQEVVQQRMLQRGDNGIAVFQRINHDKEKFRDALARLNVLYDEVHVIHNEDLNESVKEIMTTLKKIQGRKL